MDTQFDNSKRASHKHTSGTKPYDVEYTYKWSPLSILAPERHLDCVPVPCSLVEGLALLEGGAVQMQACCYLCVTDVLHSVQAYGIYTHTHTTMKQTEKGNVKAIFSAQTF